MADYMCKSSIVSQSDLQKAIEKVKRERLKAKDNDRWADFCIKEIKQYKTQPKCEIPGDTDYYNYSPQKTPIHHDDFCDLIEEVCTKNIEDIKSNEDFVHNKKKILTFSKITMVSVPNADNKMSLEKIFNSEKDKLNGFLIKTRQILEIIRIHLYDFNIPDTPAEGMQLQKKALDFCVRFSRNHSYQIELQFNNIMLLKNKLIKQPSLQMEYDFLKLLLKYYQTLYQAYNMFQRHMYIIWGYDGTVEKLNDLVKNTAESCETLHSSTKFMSSSLCADLLNTCIRIMESMKNLKNVKDPNNFQKVIKTRRIVSADINKPQSKSSYKLRCKSATPSKTKISSSNRINEIYRNIQQNKKKNNQFSMYDEHPAKIDGLCKQCRNDSKIISKCNSRSIFHKNKNSTHSTNENKIGQGYYHKDCHSSSYFFAKNKDAAKNIKPTKIKEKNAAPLIDVSNKEFSENVKLIAINDNDTLIDKNDTKSKANSFLKSIGEKRIQTINSSHSDTEIYKKPEKMKSAEKQISLDIKNQNHNNNNNDKKTLKNGLVQSPILLGKTEKIERISDGLINKELQMLEKYMDLPIDQFIKSEVEAFSKFLFKTCITKT